MKNTIFALALIIGFGAQAQQEPQFTQNFANLLYVNPAYAGANESICATGMFREQWAGFEGAPQDMLFSIHSPIILFDTSAQFNPAIGFTFYKDDIGMHSVTGYKAALTNRFYISGKGYINVGLGIGAVGLQTDLSDAVTPDEEVIIRDPNLNQDDKIRRYGLDLDFGVYYKALDGKVQVGASLKHLNGLTLEGAELKRDSAKYVQRNRFHFNPNLTLTGGYVFDQFRNWTIEPSALIKTEFRTLQVDLAVRAVYRQSVWAGINYRLEDAISPIVGFQTTALGPGVTRIGMAYDITTSKLTQYNSGSLEVFVNYCFRIQKGKEIYKNPFYL